MVTQDMDFLRIMQMIISAMITNPNSVKALKLTSKLQGNLLHINIKIKNRFCLKINRGEVSNSSLILGSKEDLL